MQHFADRSTMQVPGICFVCERTPDEGTGYVDTKTTFTPGFPSNLAGAKYICDACVKAAAEACGFYADTSVANAARAKAVAEGKFSAVLDHIGEVVKTLDREFVRNVADRHPAVVADAAAAAEAAVAKKPAPKKAKAADAPADASE